LKTSCKIASEEREVLVAENVLNACNYIGHNFKPFRWLQLNFWEDIHVRAYIKSLSLEVVGSQIRIPNG